MPVHRATKGKESGYKVSCDSNDNIRFHKQSALNPTQR